jgi:hypothetical protein
VPKMGLLDSTTASARRRGALSLFRLAGVVLRGTTGLYERHIIREPVSGLDCRFAAEVGRGIAPCRGRSHHQNRRRPRCP